MLPVTLKHEKGKQMKIASKPMIRYESLTPGRPPCPDPSARTVAVDIA